MTNLDIPGEFKAYGYVHLETVPNGEDPPEGYTGDLIWNVRADKLTEWADVHPPGTLFRCVAWVPRGAE